MTGRNQWNRHWERFVRRLHNEGKKVFITGSNASLLSHELGTHLTGRYLEWTLYPFSFTEFLEFNKIKIDKEKGLFLKKEKAIIKRNFENFSLYGGFAEYLETNNSKYLHMLYESVLYRDIVARYDIDKEKSVKELVLFCASNIGKKISFNSLTKTIGVKNASTVKNYFGYLENSFLLFLLPKYDFSLKKQIVANKKVYFIDNALAGAVGFRFSRDAGRFLENIVFLELKRQEKEIYYFEGKKECDFVVRSGLKITEALQVTDILNDENENREVGGLLEAMEKFDLKSGIILTKDQEKEIQRKGRIVKVMTIWKWLLL